MMSRDSAVAGGLSIKKAESYYSYPERSDIWNIVNTDVCDSGILQIGRLNSSSLSLCGIKIDISNS